MNIRIRRECEVYVFEYKSKSLDPLRTKKTFIRKKLGHTAVSAIQASSVTLLNLAKEARGRNWKFSKFNMAVLSNTNVSRKYQNISNLFRK